MKKAVLSIIAVAVLLGCSKIPFAPETNGRVKYVSALYYEEEDGDAFTVRYTWNRLGQILSFSIPEMDIQSSFSWSSSLQMTFNYNHIVIAGRGEISGGNLVELQLSNQDSGYYNHTRANYDGDGHPEKLILTNQYGDETSNQFVWFDGNCTLIRDSSGGEIRITYGDNIDNAGIGAHLLPFFLGNMDLFYLPFTFNIISKNLPVKITYMDDSDYDEVRITYLKDDDGNVSRATLTRYDDGPFSSWMDFTY